MNIGMIRINRPPFLADDALLYFLGHATSSSALRERPLFLAGADPRPTFEKCHQQNPDMKPAQVRFAPLGVVRMRSLGAPKADDPRRCRAARAASRARTAALDLRPSNFRAASGTQRHGEPSPSPAQTGMLTKG